MSLSDQNSYILWAISNRQFQTDNPWGVMYFMLQHRHQYCNKYYPLQTSPTGIIRGKKKNRNHAGRFLPFLWPGKKQNKRRGKISYSKRQNLDWNDFCNNFSLKHQQSQSTDQAYFHNSIIQDFGWRPKIDRSSIWYHMPSSIKSCHFDSKSI